MSSDVIRLCHNVTISWQITLSLYQFVCFFLKNKGIGDAGSTADLRMLWSAIVCLGLEVGSLGYLVTNLVKNSVNNFVIHKIW